MKEIKAFYRKFIPLEIVLIVDMSFIIFYLSNIFSYLNFFHALFTSSVHSSQVLTFLSLITYYIAICFIILNKSFKFNLSKNLPIKILSTIIFYFICLIDIYLFLLFFLRFPIIDYNLLFSIFSILCLFLHINYWQLLKNIENNG